MKRREGRAGRFHKGWGKSRVEGLGASPTSANTSRVGCSLLPHPLWKPSTFRFAGSFQQPVSGYSYAMKGLLLITVTSLQSEDVHI